jgi:hypothetical protein
VSGADLDQETEFIIEALWQRVYTAKIITRTE